MDLVFELAGIGITVTVIEKFLKAAEKPEQAALVVLAATVASVALITFAIWDVINQVKFLFL